MKDFEFIDPGFDVKHSSTYYLSIQLSLDGFSFTVLDLISNNYIAFKYKALDHDVEQLAYDYYCQYVYDFLISEELFKFPFKAIGVIYISAFSTLVPSAIYIKDKSETLFKTNIGSVDNIDILSNKIKNTDTINIFAIPDCLIRILSRQFRNFKVFHQTTPMVVKALADNRNHDNPLRLYLNQNKSICDILLVNRGQLQLFNSFRYSHVDDIVYYLVNISEQVQNIGKVNEVILCGKTLFYSDLDEKIRRYFKNISQWNLGHLYKFSDSFESSKVFEFSLLFDMPACE